MSKLLSALALVAFAAASFSTHAASHAGAAPMKASEPAAKAAPAKKGDKAASAAAAKASAPAKK
jgi:hypothetical protein